MNTELNKDTDLERHIASIRMIRLVMDERRRQDKKWGVQNHDPFTYGAILGEEYGEFLKAGLELRFGSGTLEQLKLEAVQTAAVAMAIVECLERGEWAWAGLEPIEPLDQQPL